MVERAKVFGFCLFAILLVGCGAPSATLDLITVARQGLASAQEAEIQHHEALLSQYGSQQAALDAAFDADVRLVAAGGIQNADGETVELTPEWIISARKGYAAARDMVGQNIRSTEAAHAVRIDNLRVADESLEMASQIIVQQSNLTERIKQQLIGIQRRFIDGR